MKVNIHLNYFHPKGFNFIMNLYLEWSSKIFHMSSLNAFFGLSPSWVKLKKMKKSSAQWQKRKDKMTKENWDYTYWWKTLTSLELRHFFLQKEINNVFLLDGKVSSKQISLKIRILFKGFWLMQVELKTVTLWYHKMSTFDSLEIQFKYIPYSLYITHFYLFS